MILRVHVYVESDCDIVQLAALYGDTLFNRYVWPLKQIHPQATEINKITVDRQQRVMYVDGRRVEYVDQQRAMTEFVAFIRQVSAPVVLVAHNGRRFDFPRSVACVRFGVGPYVKKTANVLVFINEVVTPRTTGIITEWLNVERPANTIW